MEISIIIPSDETSIQKKYEKKFRYTSSTTYSPYSIWSLAMYEVWKEDEVYDHILKKIKDLSLDFDCAIYKKDVSKQTEKYLEKEKNHIVNLTNFLSKSLKYFDYHPEKHNEFRDFLIYTHEAAIHYVNMKKIYK